jgi:hypothetical protein
VLQFAQILFPSLDQALFEYGAAFKVISVMDYALWIMNRGLLHAGTLYYKKLGFGHCYNYMLRT